MIKKGNFYVYIEDMNVYGWSEIIHCIAFNESSKETCMVEVDYENLHEVYSEDDLDKVIDNTDHYIISQDYFDDDQWHTFCNKFGICESCVGIYFDVINITVEDFEEEHTDCDLYLAEMDLRLDIERGK